MILESISDIYYKKGLAQFKNRDITNAQKLFQKAILFNPNESLYYNIKGLCLYKLGEFNKAKELWEKSVTIKRDEDNLAFRYLKTLEEKDFQNTCQKYNEAYYYALNKDFKKAMNLIEKNNLQDYHIVKINNFYGLCQYAKGNKHKAIGIWQGVLDIDINNPQSLQYLSKIDMSVKSSMSIIDQLKKVFKKNL